jgi:hypothetical protein
VRRERQEPPWRHPTNPSGAEYAPVTRTRALPPGYGGTWGRGKGGVAPTPVQGTENAYDIATPLYSPEERGYGGRSQEGIRARSMGRRAHRRLLGKRGGGRRISEKSLVTTDTRAGIYT